MYSKLFSSLISSLFLSNILLSIFQQHSIFENSKFVSSRLIFFKMQFCLRRREKVFSTKFVFYHIEEKMHFIDKKLGWRWCGVVWCGQNIILLLTGNFSSYYIHCLSVFCILKNMFQNHFSNFVSKMSKDNGDLETELDIF